MGEFRRKFRKDCKTHLDLGHLTTEPTTRRNDTSKRRSDHHMKLEAEKLFQSINLKLRERTAIFAIGQGVLLAALWLFMRDYSAHHSSRP